MACVRYIENFSNLSSLHANLDKTKVVPFGNNFNIKDKLCQNLPFEWENNFTLLGIEVDNRLEDLDCNFNIVHSRTPSLINDWRGKYPLRAELISPNASLSVSILMWHPS